MKLALIPHAGCVCSACLRAGSRGFVFDHKFSPHKNGKMNCKCEFMPGIEGETRIEGYDKSAVYDEWKALYGDNPIKSTDFAPVDLSSHDKYGYPSSSVADDYFRSQTDLLALDENASKSFAVWAHDSGQINLYARGNRDALTAIQEIEAECQSDFMSRFISSCVLDEDIIVYRTLFEDVFDMATNDSIYYDKGYTATSCCFDFIREGADGSGAGSVWMKITVPKGIGRGAYINSVSEFDEAEYVLHRDAKILINGYNIDNEGRKIYEGVLL